VTAALARQVLVIARRSVRRTLRQPALVLLPIVFPLVLFAVVAGGLKAAADLPGFPSGSYVSFALTIAFIQGAMLCMNNVGIEVAHDIESGFLTRLTLMPVRPVALALGQTAGILVLGLLQASAFLAAGLAFGASIAAGAGGVVVLVALFALCVAGFGSLGALVALRTGSGEAVQTISPLLLVVLFLSSWNLPRDAIEASWFKAVATANPVSYLLEGMRSLLVAGWDAQALALAFGLAAVLAVGTLAATARALDRRMVRT
jgi:ABC-2 type transport system permease protein